MERWEKILLWAIGIIVVSGLLMVFFSFKISDIILALIALGLVELSYILSKRFGKWKVFWVEILMDIILAFIFGALLHFPAEKAGDIIGSLIAAELLMAIFFRNEPKTDKNKK